LKLLNSTSQKEEEDKISMRGSSFNFKSSNHADEPQEKEPIKIICFDGLIDSTWIEFLNFINDDSKTHCMASGDIFKLNNHKIVFETENLSLCSPSFIARNYVVHFDYETIKWENILYDFISLNKKINCNNDLKNYVRGLFENYFPKIYEFILSNKSISFTFSENYIFKNFITLFDSILPEYDFEDKKLGRRNLNMISKIDIIKKSALSIFIFSCAWTVNFFTNFILKTKIEKLISDIFKADDLRGPIFDYYIDEEKHIFAAWSEKLDSELHPEIFKKQEINKKNNNGKYLYNKLFVPTIDNICYQWILDKYIKAGKPVFYTGKVGVGKSLLINDLLNQLDENKDEVFNLRYLINYNSTSKKIENFLMNNLKYVKRDLIGDLYNRKVVFFVDDCNLQKADNYNSQSCLEYLRQIINTNYIYDMKSNMVKRLDKFFLLATGNLSAFGKNPNMDRFIHSLTLMSQNSVSDESVNVIFKPSLESHIKQLIPNTSSITSNQYILASLNILNWVNNNLKSVPNKLHYKFGLRDLSKIFQSIINYKYIGEPIHYTKGLTKIWFNECMRIFEDKLTNENDLKLFRKNLLTMYNGALKQSIKADVIYNTKHMFFGYEINLPQKPQNLLVSEGNVSSAKPTEGNEKDSNSNKEPNSNKQNSDANNTNGNKEKDPSKDPLNQIEDLIVGAISNDTSFNPREYLLWEDSIELKNTMIQKYDEFIKANKMRQFILNNDMFELVIKIIRAIHFNKGNVLFVTHTLSGKLLMAQFAAYLERRVFYDVDETVTMRDEAFIYNFFRKILLETIYKNQEVVLFFNNKMLEKDEVLEILNNIINTGEILINYNNLKGEGEFSDVKIDDKTKISRIENNLSIVMNVLPNSTAYKKLFYNYTYISKHCQTIYIDKTNDEILYNLARDTIPELEYANQKFGKFSKFLLDIHIFMEQLAQEYEEKLNFHIEINPKNFIDMLTYYDNNYFNFKEHLLNQKKKYDFACETITKLQEIIQRVNEEIVQLEPQMNDNEKILNDKRAELIKKMGNRNTLQNAKSEEEKPMHLLVSNLEKVQEVIKENLAETDRKIQTSITPLLKYEKDDLTQYRNIIENHHLSKFILAQIYTFLGENAEWDSIKKNLDPKYFKNLLGKEYGNYPAALVKMVRETVANPEFNPEGLPRNFIITKQLGEWFLSMDAYFTEYEKQKQLFDEIDDMNLKIAEMEKSVNAKGENIKEVQNQISELEKSISENDRIKMNLNLKIKNRNDLKLICEDFINTHTEKIEFWQDKGDALNKKLENLEFYLAFIACYINYAPAFNFSYRKKIKSFFLSKSEEYGFLSVKRINFYSIIQEFIDLKKEKDIIIHLIPYDEFTKENLLLIHLSKKTPFLIDHNRVSKWILKEFYDKKDNKKTTSVKQGDLDIEEVIDKALKDGMCLMIERVDSKIFDIFKNVVLDNKTQEKGKTYVQINNSNREVSDRFKLFFVKDKIDTLIDSQVWIETLVINFIPCKEVLRGTIIRELLANDGDNMWNAYMKVSSDIFRDTIKIIDLEDKINQILTNFDYSGSVEKNSNNSLMLEKLKLEYQNHNNLLIQMETNNEKLTRYQEDIGKFSLISDEAGRLFKQLSKFTNIDNIYNFGFAVYLKFVKDFYNEK